MNDINYLSASDPVRSKSTQFYFTLCHPYGQAIKYERLFFLRSIKWSAQKYQIIRLTDGKSQLLPFLSSKESTQTNFFSLYISKHYHPVAQRILEAAQLGQLQLQKTNQADLKM